MQPQHILQGFNLAEIQQPVLNPNSVQGGVNTLRDPTYVLTRKHRSQTHPKVSVTPLTAHFTIRNLIQSALNRFIQ
eukprot:13003807-Ditylum_brightwellii.AAC.1